MESYLGTARVSPLFVLGDALDVLREFPSDIFDCCMTSPPYWGKREYANSGIGLERDYRDFIRNLGAVCREIKRVLKPAGSFWLNIGDSYAGKNLIGIPWRIAIELMDEQGWIMRNSVIWNKIKGDPTIRKIACGTSMKTSSISSSHREDTTTTPIPSGVRRSRRRWSMDRWFPPQGCAGFGTGGKSSCLRSSPKRKRQMPSARWSRCSAVLPLVRLPTFA